MNDITLDLNIGESNLDAVDRARLQIRNLEHSNQIIRQQICQLVNKPANIILMFEKKLKSKINQLRQENNNIQNRIQMGKMPGFAQMTKKKTPHTPNKTNVYKNMKNSLNQQWENNNNENSRKNLFDSIEMSDKYQLSTCQNFNMQYSQQNPLRTLQPMQRQQLHSRTQMTMQLLQLLRKAQKFEQQIVQVETEGALQQQQQMAAKSRQIIKQKQAAGIYKYKNKLLCLIHRLKQKQSNSEKLVQSYRVMYEETLMQLQQTTELLHSMQDMDNSSMSCNVDDLYAEVLQLEQRLKYINESIEKLDEKSWLKEMVEQLLKALKRLNIQAPQYIECCQQQEVDGLREYVDRLCQVLTQVALLDKCEEKDRLVMLRHYHEQQKQNNKRILKKMQNKEQMLSKKLIDIQMHSSC